MLKMLDKLPAFAKIQDQIACGNLHGAALPMAIAELLRVRITGALAARGGATGEKTSKLPRPAVGAAVTA